MTESTRSDSESPISSRMTAALYATMTVLLAVIVLIALLPAIRWLATLRFGVGGEDGVIHPIPVLVGISLAAGSLTAVVRSRLLGPRDTAASTWPSVLLLFAAVTISTTTRLTEAPWSDLHAAFAAYRESLMGAIALGVGGLAVGHQGTLRVACFENRLHRAVQETVGLGVAYDVASRLHDRVLVTARELRRSASDDDLAALVRLELAIRTLQAERRPGPHDAGARSIRDCLHRPLEYATVAGIPVELELEDIRGLNALLEGAVASHFERGMNNAVALSTHLSDTRKAYDPLSPTVGPTLTIDFAKTGPVVAFFVPRSRGGIGGAAEPDQLELGSVVEPETNPRMGLATVAAELESVDGSLEIHEAESGTTFVFTLPERTSQ